MNRIWGYIAVTLFFAAGTLLALAYLRSGSVPQPPPWAGGEIRVGYSSEPPYAFRTPAGEITGIGPETAKAVLARLGNPSIRWVLLDFGQAVAALEAGQIDLLANGLFITPERAGRVLFTLPYARVGQSLLVGQGNPRKLASYEDVAAAPDVIAAVLDGSVEETALLALGMPRQRLFVIPDPAAGLAAVRSGRADCLALSGPTVRWLAGESQGEAEEAKPFAQPAALPPGESAFALRKADARLAESMNAALRGVVGSQALAERLAPLGFGRQNLPPWSLSR
jgi:polar amino acid transport system substrate-binding protein